MTFVKGVSPNPGGKPKEGKDNIECTPQWLIDRANEARRLALKARQPGAAIVALRFMAEMKGYLAAKAKELEEQEATRKKGVDAPPPETMEQYTARQREHFDKLNGADRLGHGPRKWTR
jgi:hypothetical protein